jgi:hypothetical protein
MNFLLSRVSNEIEQAIMIDESNGSSIPVFSGRPGAGAFGVI